MTRPVVLVVANRDTRKNKLIDYVGEFHLDLLTQCGAFPVIVPVVKGTLPCLPQYMERMDGLLLVEGDDIEPKRYAARKANFKYVDKTLPLKDEIEIRLLREALRREIPIMGICRGSQLLNVVCGGTLYGDVQKEKGTHRAHIDYENYDTYRHPVDVLPGTPLAHWYRRKALKVNSYHHQGVRELAARFRPMAHADDGLIEGYYDPKAAFVVGLQFHPERMLNDYAGNLKVWKAFTGAMKGGERQYQGADGR
ncbi:MAG: gamma-glutamyl-gamma-aminobutyrate hydrolase family protein [Terracidiphilus sp.]|jgi:gamma-glutamyl-gamma-aminobutyrate hydrolase PuuD